MASSCLPLVVNSEQCEDYKPITCNGAVSIETEQKTVEIPIAQSKFAKPSTLRILALIRQE